MFIQAKYFGAISKSNNKLIVTIVSTVASFIDLYMILNVLLLIQNRKEMTPTMFYKLLSPFPPQITNVAPNDTTHVSVWKKCLCLRSDVVDSSIPFV